RRRAVGGAGPHPHPARAVHPHHDGDQQVNGGGQQVSGGGRQPTGGRALAPALVFIALVVAVVGSLGAPLITAVAERFHVTLAQARWPLTAPLLAGAVATPVLGRLGSGRHRRPAMLATLGLVLAGSVLTVVPPSFGWLLAGRTAQGLGLGLTAL